jgi:hypothetical protein
MDATVLAAAFRREMQKELTREQLIEIDARNAAESNPNVCHSHDLCDANEPMAAAMASLGLEFDASNQEQVDVINAAWAMVKREGFAS